MGVVAGCGGHGDRPAECVALVRVASAPSKCLHGEHSRLTLDEATGEGPVDKGGMVMLRATRVVLGAVGVSIGLLAGTSGVSADHAGETATSDTTEGLTDGQTITISVTNMLMPGMSTAQIMMANTWPVVGPDAFNLAEFGEAPTVTINPDGTGTFDYAVKIDHGTYNCLEIQCHVVVFQGMGFDSYTAGLPVSFADPAAATTPPTEAPPATDAPAPTEAPEVSLEESAQADDSGDDSGGGSAGIIIAVVAAVVVIGGGGAALAKRRKS